MRVAELKESLEWGNEHDKGVFMSLKGLVNKNNGVFKSQAQQKYVKNNTLKHEPDRDAQFCKETFGIDVGPGEKLVMVSATAVWADYGSRGAIPVRYGFVMDDIGVSKFYKIGNKGNLRTGSQPDASKTKLEWVRPENVDAKHLELTDDQKAAEVAKKKKEFVVKMGGSFGNYIGKEGDKKHDFGKVTLVALSDGQPGTWGMSYWHMFKDVNGDIIYYTGSHPLGMQKGESKNMVANIKRHLVSKKGDKVTVVNRPKFS